MKRGTRFFIAFASAIITFVSLTAFVGPRYHMGWQYYNYYGGYHRDWGHPYYRPYWQQSPYPPPYYDSLYQRQPLPQRDY